MAIRSHDSLIAAPAELAAALRLTTELLAMELAAPTEQPPDWTSSKWAVARAAVTIHGIAGLLLRDLRWPGMPGWYDFLERETAETRERERRAVSALADIDAAARAAGIPLVALKGHALLALGMYEPGERPMADIDLLVRPRDRIALERVMASMGFAAVSVSWKHWEFARPLSGSAAAGEVGLDAIKVDVHQRLAEQISDFEIEMPGDLFGTDPGTGVRGYPSRPILLRHLLMHTAANMSTRWVRAVHLSDIARVASGLTPAEWAETLPRHWTHSWCLLPPLALVARYFPGVVPPDLVAQVEVACPRGLARAVRRQVLTDLSASDPRFRALPAFDWCTSLPGVLRYMKRRVLPGRSELRSLAGIARTTGFARDNRWFTMSQPARIMQWVFRRPMRPATLHAVRVEFARKAVTPVGEPRQ